MVDCFEINFRSATEGEVVGLRAAFVELSSNSGGSGFLPALLSLLFYFLIR